MKVYKEVSKIKPMKFILSWGNGEKVPYYWYYYHCKALTLIRINNKNDIAISCRVITTEKEKILAHTVDIIQAEGNERNVLISDEFIVSNSRILSCQEFKVGIDKLPEEVEMAMRWHAQLGRVQKSFLVSPIPPKDWKIYIGARSTEECTPKILKALVNDIPEAYWKFIRVMVEKAIELRLIDKRIKIVGEIRLNVDPIGVKRCEIIERVFSSFGGKVSLEYFK
jgi:hypothetical protein